MPHKKRRVLLGVLYADGNQFTGQIPSLSKLRNIGMCLEELDEVFVSFSDSVTHRP